MSKGKDHDKNKWEEFNENEANMDENTVENKPEEELTFATRQQLEDQLTATERKAEEYKEKALRTQAEMENLRRRTERDIANSIKFGSEKLLADLIPVVDSMVRGMDSPESHDPHAKSMREGMALTLDLLLKTLTKHGVQIIDPKPGEPFNPVLHEAISMQKQPGAQHNTILQVMQKGYQLNDRVIRAAMVVVAG